MRGREPAIDALRSGQERRAAGRASGPPSAPAAGEGSYRTGESSAWLAGRIRHRNPARRCSPRAPLPEILEDPDNGLSATIRELLGEIRERLKFIEDRLDQYNLRIDRLFRQDERCRRLAEVEGVGPLIATALVAAVGNATEFKSGRELAAYLGLVPRHRASGGRTVLLGISKRGDRYLRTLLVHGARATMRTIERRSVARCVWASRLKLQRGTNVAAVALANKNARLLWALLKRGESYRPAPFPARVPQVG